MEHLNLFEYLRSEPDAKISDVVSVVETGAKIRDGIDGYYAFNDYWIRCLYEDENGTG